MYINAFNLRLIFIHIWIDEKIFNKLITQSERWRSGIFAYCVQALPTFPRPPSQQLKKTKEDQKWA